MSPAVIGVTPPVIASDGSIVNVIVSVMTTLSHIRISVLGSVTRVSPQCSRIPTTESFSGFYHIVDKTIVGQQFIIRRNMDCGGSDLHQSYGIKNYAGLDSKDKTFYRFLWFRFRNTA